jgi:hypothetical protein
MSGSSYRALNYKQTNSNYFNNIDDRDLIIETGPHFTNDVSTGNTSLTSSDQYYACRRKEFGLKMILFLQLILLYKTTKTDLLILSICLKQSNLQALYYPTSNTGKYELFNLEYSEYINGTDLTH